MSLKIRTTYEGYKSLQIFLGTFCIAGGIFVWIINPEYGWIPFLVMAAYAIVAYISAYRFHKLSLIEKQRQATLKKEQEILKEKTEQEKKKAIKKFSAFYQKYGEYPTEEEIIRIIKSMPSPFHTSYDHIKISGTRPVTDDEFYSYMVSYIPNELPSVSDFVRKINMSIEILMRNISPNPILVKCILLSTDEVKESDIIEIAKAQKDSLNGYMNTYYRINYNWLAISYVSHEISRCDEIDKESVLLINQKIDDITHGKYTLPEWEL